MERRRRQQQQHGVRACACVCEYARISRSRGNARARGRTVKLSVKLADRPTKCWYMHTLESMCARGAESYERSNPASPASQPTNQPSCQPARQASKQAAAGGRSCAYALSLASLWPIRRHGSQKRQQLWRRQRRRRRYCEPSTCSFVCCTRSTKYNIRLYNLYHSIVQMCQFAAAAGSKCNVEHNACVFFCVSVCACF